MFFWKSMIYRWDKETLKMWPSLKKSAYMLLPLLLYFFIHDAVEILMWAGLDVLMQRGSEDAVQFLTSHTDTIRGMINGAVILIGTAVIWPAISNELKGEVRPESKRETKNISVKEKNSATACAEPDNNRRTTADTVTRYGMLLGLAFCMAVGLNILFTQIGFVESSESFDEVYRQQYGVQFAVGLILYGIVSPFAEEAVFRGLLYNRMKRCFPMGLALFFSALLFGCYHGNVVQAMYGTILGMVIAYLYEIMGGFEVPVLFHGMANISVYVLSYGNHMRQLSSVTAWGIIVVSMGIATGLLLYIVKNCKK